MKKLMIFNVIAMLLFACSDTNDTIDLNASVVFTGTQFVIQNKDSFDYTNATLELNDDYTLQNVTIPSGNTFTVGILNFSDKKGNRFGIMMKPLKFTIWCDIDNDKKGFFYSESD
jgi:hypothetical protein